MTRSAFVVSHHLDGFLLLTGRGLVASHYRPWGSPGCRPLSHASPHDTPGLSHRCFALQSLPLRQQRVARHRTSLPPRRSPPCWVARPRGLLPLGSPLPALPLPVGAGPLLSWASVSWSADLCSRPEGCDQPQPSRAAHRSRRTGGAVSSASSRTSSPTRGMGRRGVVAPATSPKRDVA